MKTVVCCLVSVLLIIAVFLMSGCASPFVRTKAQSLNVPSECVKLWDIDLGESLSLGSEGRYFARWLRDDLTVELFVYRGYLSDTDRAETTKKIIDGIACYTNKSAIAWDGTNEAGEWIGDTNYSQTLAYEQNGLVCKLSGTTDKRDVSLDIVALKTAQSLMDRSASEYQQFRKTIENWSIGFQKGKIAGSISIIPPPFAQAAYHEWANSENVSLVKDGDLEYYRLKPEDQEDSPNNAAIAYLSSYGLIEIRGGVPYDNRNDVPRRELDFINIEMAKQVRQLVFAG